MDDPYTSTPCFGLFTCYVATLEIISSSLDFNEIHRDVHGRSFMKKGSFFPLLIMIFMETRGVSVHVYLTNRPYS